jgi:hypothetical protein
MGEKIGSSSSRFADLYCGAIYWSPPALGPRRPILVGSVEEDGDELKAQIVELRHSPRYGISAWEDDPDNHAKCAALFLPEGRVNARQLSEPGQWADLPLTFSGQEITYVLAPVPPGYDESD